MKGSPALFQLLPFRVRERRLVRSHAECYRKRRRQVAGAEVLGGLFVWLLLVPVLSAGDRKGELV